MFFTRTIESEYVDYNRMIPRDNDIILSVDRDRLLEGLERANIIAEEKIQGSGRITGLEALVEKAGGIIHKKAFVLAEADAADRPDVIYLAKIPLF